MSRTVTIGLSNVLATACRWPDARFTELRKWTGFSDATLTRALKDLLDLGLIEAHTRRKGVRRVYVTYKPTGLGKEITPYLYYVSLPLLLEFVLKRLRDEASRIYAKHQVKSFEELWSKLERGEVSEVECREDLERLDYLESRIESVRKRLRK